MLLIEVMSRITLIKNINKKLQRRRMLMKKRILIAVMTFILCGTSANLTHAGARNDVQLRTESRILDDGWYDVGDWDDNGSTDNDGWDMDNDSQDDNTDGWDDDYWDDDGWDDDSWDDDNDNIDDWDTDDDWEEDVTLALTDISVNPKSKIIKKGKVFYIEIVPANKNDWVSSDEWEEVCGDNIASVEFTSTKSSIVSASKFNGKIKGKKKGTAIIKTKITLINNESIVLKTKVTVKK